MVRMHWNNKKLLFQEYRGRTSLYLVYTMIRYCMFFQVLFYSVMGNFFYLGSMDHLMSRSGIVSATNKDSITIGRCTALMDVIRFNSGSWTLSLYIIGLSYVVWMEAVNWDYTAIPDFKVQAHLDALLFCGPATFMALMAFIIPLLLNPFVLGWPFNPPLWCCRKKKTTEATKITNTNPRNLKSSQGGKVVDLKTFMNDNAANEVEREAKRVMDKPDVELGSLATREVGSPRGGRPVGRNSRPAPRQSSNGRNPQGKALI
jgi:hypothetical protein